MKTLRKEVVALMPVGKEIRSSQIESVISAVEGRFNELDRVIANLTERIDRLETDLRDRALIS